MAMAKWWLLQNDPIKIIESPLMKSIELVDKELRDIMQLTQSSKVIKDFQWSLQRLIAAREP